jgi:soluble lytic murein transglycosylase-like protein
MILSSLLLATCLNIAPSNPYSSTIDYLARIKGLDPEIALAIVAQESSFRQITTVRNGKPTDIGLMQIHEFTARVYKMDMGRLIFDERYNLEQGIKVLADKSKHCKGLASWACYHSTTPAKRWQYVLAVSRHL